MTSDACSHIRSCEKCGFKFLAERSWSSLCLVCWKESKDWNLLAGDKQMRVLQRELAVIERRYIRTLSAMAQLEQKYADAVAQLADIQGQLPLDSSSFSPGRFKTLLLLCHPDHHHNSQKSTEITQWLLELRKHK